MPLLIPCPNCGVRPYGEFWCSGELPEGGHGGSDPDPEEDFARIWLKRNVAGAQVERWFHHAGCRRWLTVSRDTTTNVADGLA